MKILYDAYISGQKYVLEAKVTDKYPLETENIFIVESTSDEFVKVASLSEITAVPDVRYREKYYRKNFVIIPKDTITEADTIRKIIDKQVNSLANELATIEEFYRSETEVEYPNTAITEEVDKLYNQYLQIKEKYNSLLTRRAELTTKKSTVESDYKYFTSLLDPVIEKLSTDNRGIDISDTIKTLSSIRSVIKPITDSISNINQVLNNYLSPSTLVNFDKANTELYAAYTGTAGLKVNYESAAKKTVILQKLYDIHQNYSSIKTSISSSSSLLNNLRASINSVIGYRVNKDGTTTPELLVSESSINSAISSISSIASAITTERANVASIIAVIDSIKAKYIKDLKAVESEILSVNRQIDTHSKAIQELKDEILIKDPTFDLSLL